MRRSRPAAPPPAALAVQRLSDAEITEFLAEWPREQRELALELRRLVLRVAPQLDERIAFGALCYVVPGRPYGVIGGGACGIGRRKDTVQLGFLHGAFLPDPERRLRGKGKAKRHLELPSRESLDLRGIEALVRAAVAFDPSKTA